MKTAFSLTRNMKDIISLPKDRMLRGHLLIELFGKSCMGAIISCEQVRVAE
jgi:hypothetical protein